MIHNLLQLTEALHRRDERSRLVVVSATSHSIYCTSFLNLTSHTIFCTKILNLRQELGFGRSFAA